MTRFRTVLAGGLSSMTLIATLVGAANAAPGRIPVSSTDDANQSIPNRIAAVDHVVVAMGGRIDRIVAGLPEGHPPSPILAALGGARSSIGALIGTIDTRVCNQDGVIGTGDASLADSDAFAADSSSTGLVNQLDSVTGVLGEAQGRLIRIIGAYPPGAPTVDVQNALLAVRSAAAAAFETISGRVADGVHPPSPCVNA
ncbi:MAG: hypothetical protein QOF49_865 [Chloroflexota bacterium]|nr:hypothetical protein [Chloroflexota bacterium]